MERITKMLTANEVCEDLGISPTHLRALVSQNFLHPTKLGKGYKYSQEDLLEFQRAARGKDLSNLEALVLNRA